MLMNLCVALILSYVVFISAVEKADIEVGNRNLEYSSMQSYRLYLCIHYFCDRLIVYY